MTVVGQCIGAGKVEEARYYMVKLCGYAEIVILISCAVVFLLTKPVTFLAGMEAESASLCMEMIIAITIVKPIVWVLAFIPAYGMRAAGDVKFSMILSSLTMWLCRVALCVYLIRSCGFTNGGVDWHVCRLDASCYRIQRPVFKRQVEPDTCHLEHA